MIRTSYHFLWYIQSIGSKQNMSLELFLFLLFKFLTKPKQTKNFPNLEQIKNVCVLLLLITKNAMTSFFIKCSETTYVYLIMCKQALINTIDQRLKWNNAPHDKNVAFHLNEICQFYLLITLSLKLCSKITGSQLHKIKYPTLQCKICFREGLKPWLTGVADLHLINMQSWRCW